MTAYSFYRIVSLQADEGSEVGKGESAVDINLRSPLAVSEGYENFAYQIYEFVRTASCSVRGNYVILTFIASEF